MCVTFSGILDVNMQLSCHFLQKLPSVDLHIPLTFRVRHCISSKVTELLRANVLCSCYVLKDAITTTCLNSQKRACHPTADFPTKRNLDIFPFTKWQTTDKQILSQDKACLLKISHLEVNWGFAVFWLHNVKNHMSKKKKKTRVWKMSANSL